MSENVAASSPLSMVSSSYSNTAKNKQRSRNNNKNRNKGKGGDIPHNEASSVTATIAPLTASPSPSLLKPKVSPKKSYKVIIRKLPTRGFNLDNFTQCVEGLYSALNVSSSSLKIDHFTEGKLTRLKGPVPGVGYLTIDDVSALSLLLTKCICDDVKFIEDDDVNRQPEISLAPCTKTIRQKMRADKMDGTYEADPEYQAFIHREQEFENQKSLSAEALYDTKTTERQTLKEDPKNIPLLKYLKEKGGSRRLYVGGSSKPTYTDRSRKDDGRGSGNSKRSKDRDGKKSSSKKDKSSKDKDGKSKSSKSRSSKSGKNSEPGNSSKKDGKSTPVNSNTTSTNTAYSDAVKGNSNNNSSNNDSSNRSDNSGRSQGKRDSKPSSAPTANIIKIIKKEK